MLVSISTLINIHSRVPTAVVSRPRALHLTNRMSTAGTRQPGSRARRDGVSASGSGERHEPVPECRRAGAAPGILGR